MNLTELQVELRGMEEHLSFLHNEIEKMKPKTDEEKKMDYKIIDRLASNYPIFRGWLAKAPRAVKKEFISSLSYISLSSGKDVYARLLYLTRISVGCKADLLSEDIYKSGLAFDKKELEKFCVIMDEYKRACLVEALVLANLTGNPSKEMLTIISDIAELMGCDKEEIRYIAQIAKSKLIGDTDILLDLPAPSKNRWMNEFRDYIPREWIVKNRHYCDTICVKRYYYKKDSTLRWSLYSATGTAEKNYYGKSPSHILDRLWAGEIVKKGDVLCIYTTSVEKEVKAPCDGIVFFINEKKRGKVSEAQDEYLSVYVVSYFDDYDDFAAWVNSGENKEDDLEPDVW